MKFKFEFFKLSFGKSLSCGINDPSSYNCKWSDTFVFIQDILTFISLALMSTVVSLRLFWFIPEVNYHRRNPIGQNYVEGQQINLPYFIKCDKQKGHSQKYKYDNNYNDNNPYQSSVI
ncbi:unnamed protein product [Onchocerca flexuosa]|uniref:Uncharacterized protein n=1 Tax=Onchocerca flexuosa TaxID=387005 RepID=A0A3P8AS73_9BILA|nr:unnamed protein product [Onchocerca flexuosa]